MKRAFGILLYGAVASVSAINPFDLPSCVRQLTTTSSSALDGIPFTVPELSLTFPASSSSTFPIPTQSSRTSVFTTSTTSTTSAIDSTTWDPDISSAQLQPQPPSTTHTVYIRASAQSIFDPNQIIASVGDVVRFLILGRGATVKQSTLQTPCQPNGQFHFGLHAIRPQNRTQTQAQAPFVDFAVLDTDPKWFYLKPDGEEQCDETFVFAINPGDNMDEFLARARYAATSTKNGTWMQSKRSYTEAWPGTVRYTDRGLM